MPTRKTGTKSKLPITIPKGKWRAPLESFAFVLHDAQGQVYVVPSSAAEQFRRPDLEVGEAKRRLFDGQPPLIQMEHAWKIRQVQIFESA